MTIGIVHTHLSIGGGTRQLLTLAQHVSKKHKVIIFTHTSNIAPSYKHLTRSIIIHKVFDKPQTHGKIFNLLFPIISQIQLARLILRYKVDILQPHEWPNQWACVLVKFCRFIPVVWMCNDVWHIPGNAESEEKRRVHMAFHVYIISFIDRFLTRFVDEIVVLDNRIKGILTTYYEKDIHVFRSGIEPADFRSIMATETAKKHLGLERKFVFLCVSIFFPHRRFEDVIGAFSHTAKTNKNAMLVIIGSTTHAPAYADSIKKLIEKEKLGERVRLETSFIDEHLLKTYYAGCDVFVFPNERQTWGLAVLEAMVSGKPCIVSDGAGVYEVLTEGKTGFIYPVGNVRKLVFVMKKLLEDATLRRSVGESARAFVLQNYTWKEYVAGMQSLLAETVSL